MRQDAEFIDGFVEDFGSDFLFGGGLSDNLFGFSAGGEFGAEEFQGARQAAADDGGLELGVSASGIAFSGLRSVAGGFPMMGNPLGFSACGWRASGPSLSRRRRLVRRFLRLLPTVPTRQCFRLRNLHQHHRHRPRWRLRHSHAGACLRDGQSSERPELGGSTTFNALRHCGARPGDGSPS